MEKVLEQTSEDHVDYIPLGQALEGLQDLKNVHIYILKAACSSQ